LPEFIATQGHQVVGQVAGGHALGDLQGLGQRNDDLSGDRPSGNQTEGQRQRSGDQQHVLGMGGIGVAHHGLRFGELLAGRDQDVALGRHVGQCGGVLDL